MFTSIVGSPASNVSIMQRNILNVSKQDKVTVLIIRSTRLGSIYLAGILKGSFHDTEFIGTDTFLKQNVGIAAVTSVYKLQEILFSPRTIELRKKALG